MSKPGTGSRGGEGGMNARAFSDKDSTAVGGTSNAEEEGDL